MPKRVLIGISSWLSLTKHSIKCRQFVSYTCDTKLWKQECKAVCKDEYRRDPYLPSLSRLGVKQPPVLFLKICPGDNSEMWFLTIHRFERSLLTMKNVWSLMHLSFCWKHIYNWFFITQLWNYSFFKNLIQIVFTHPLWDGRKVKLKKKAVEVVRILSSFKSYVHSLSGIVYKIYYFL